MVKGRNFWENRFRKGGQLAVLGKAHWKKRWFTKRQAEDARFLQRLFVELRLVPQMVSLDFGCGGGRLVPFLLKWVSKTLYCVDAAPTALRLVKRDHVDERLVPVLWSDQMDTVGKFSFFFSFAGLCYEHDEKLIGGFLREKMLPGIAVIIESRKPPRKRKDGSKLRTQRQFRKLFEPVGLKLQSVRVLPHQTRDRLTAFVFLGPLAWSTDTCPDVLSGKETDGAEGCKNDDSLL